jgi:hypothetical protein
MLAAAKSKGPTASKLRKWIAEKRGVGAKQHEDHFLRHFLSQRNYVGCESWDDNQKFCRVCKLGSIYLVDLLITSVGCESWPAQLSHPTVLFNRIPRYCKPSFATPRRIANPSFHTKNLFVPSSYKKSTSATNAAQSYTSCSKCYNECSALAYLRVII